MGALMLLLAYPTFKYISGASKEKISQAREDYENGERWTRYSKGSTTTSHEYDAVVGVVPAIKYFVLMLMCAAGFVEFATNFTWLQIWIAPRVFLVEYAAKLAGS